MNNISSPDNQINQALIGSSIDHTDQSSCSSSSSSCYFCNGFYGPSFDEPICTTCHDFIYGRDGLDFRDVDDSIYEPILIFPEPADNDDDVDNGIIFPRMIIQKVERVSTTNTSTTPHHASSSQSADDELDQRNGPPPTKLCKLNETLGLTTTTTTTAPTTPSITNQVEVFLNPAPLELLLKVPPEMWFTIFTMLDDTSLLMASAVCTKWSSMIQAHYPDSHWENYIKVQWPLLRQPVVGHVVQSWYSLALNLMDSLCCKSCYFKIPSQIQQLVLVESDIRHLRLATELGNWEIDSPEGIEAIPLDNLNYSWLARMTGPPDSPYEGGVFYLHLIVPPGYPWKPPTVRFLTKIYHPNISRHGDIGISTFIDGQWVPSATICSILIGIQSLLTDPYLEVSMEPNIASLYCMDRPAYEEVARAWTWKYAMNEILAQ